MATYISLLKYTEKGAANIKESPARLDAARKLFQSMGAELKQWYLVMGQYDAVVISEGPNDDTFAKLLLATGALGNIKTETFRAFTEDDSERSSLPFREFPQTNVIDASLKHQAGEQDCSPALFHRNNWQYMTN